MKKVFIRGDKERGSEVIKMLEDLGGINRYSYVYCAGARENALYYINKDNQIDCALLESNIGLVIQECFEELHLPEPAEKLPNTWEEWVKLNSKIADESFIAGGCTIKRMDSERRVIYIDDNILATQKDAEAILALIKLKRLRDTYRQGWIPDWKDDSETKYCIEYNEGDLVTDCIYNTQLFLAFQASEIRDKFYTNFKDLIETAKEFI